MEAGDLLCRPLKKKKKNTSSFSFLNENFVFRSEGKKKEKDEMMSCIVSSL